MPGCFVQWNCLALRQLRNTRRLAYSRAEHPRHARTSRRARTHHLETPALRTPETILLLVHYPAKRLIPSCTTGREGMLLSHLRGRLASSKTKYRVVFWRDPMLHLEITRCQQNCRTMLSPAT